MSEKKPKQNTTKNNKKASKNRKSPTVRPDNGVEIPAKTSYIEDTKHIKINNIDIDNKSL